MRASPRPYTVYEADDISGEESGSESPRRTWKQGEANDENEYAASTPGKHETTEDATKRFTHEISATPSSDRSSRPSLESIVGAEKPTNARAATPSSDRPSRKSLGCVLEMEKDIGNRDDRVSSAEDHLVPSVLSFGKERTFEQSQEAPFAETEHQTHQQHPRESGRDEPIPSAVRARHTADAPRRKRPKRRRRKSAVDATSDGEIHEQQHQQDNAPAGSREQQHQQEETSVASRHGVDKPGRVASKTAAKHKLSIGEVPPEEDRWDRHASSASSHNPREHRHHHHHKDHHKDHKVNMCAGDKNAGSLGVSLFSRGRKLSSRYKSSGASELCTSQNGERPRRTTCGAFQRRVTHFHTLKYTIYRRKHHDSDGGNAICFLRSETSRSAYQWIFANFQHFPESKKRSLNHHVFLEFVPLNIARNVRCGATMLGCSKCRRGHGSGGLAGRAE